MERTISEPLDVHLPNSSSLPCCRPLFHESMSIKSKPYNYSGKENFEHEKLVWVFKENLMTVMVLIRYAGQIKCTEFSNQP